MPSNLVGKMKRFIVVSLVVEDNGVFQIAAASKARRAQLLYISSKGKRPRRRHLGKKTFPIQLQSVAHAANHRAGELDKG